MLTPRISGLRFEQRRCRYYWRRIDMGYKDQLGDKPYAAPPHNGTDTSRKAAKKISASSKALLNECLMLVRKAGRHGRTCDEAEAILESRLGSSTHQTVSARFNDLMNMGLIVCNPDDPKDRRPTRKGSPARIYRTPEFAGRPGTSGSPVTAPVTAATSGSAA